jgi:hypothetical protein
MPRARRWRGNPVARMRVGERSPGSSSVRAAMIYQGATRDRDKVIAQALGGFIRLAVEKTEEPGMRGQRESGPCISA